MPSIYVDKSVVRTVGFVALAFAIYALVIAFGPSLGETGAQILQVIGLLTLVTVLIND